MRSRRDLPQGLLCGLLLRDELSHFPPAARVADVMDRAPCCIHRHWPLERAHRLFTAMGLRHLLVLDLLEPGRPVGIVTRHDLQEHSAPAAARSLRATLPAPPADGEAADEAAAPVEPYLSRSSASHASTSLLPWWMQRPGGGGIGGGIGGGGGGGGGRESDPAKHGGLAPLRARGAEGGAGGPCASTCGSEQLMQWPDTSDGCGAHAPASAMAIPSAPAAIGGRYHAEVGGYASPEARGVADSVSDSEGRRLNFAGPASPSSV